MKKLLMMIGAAGCLALEAFANTAALSVTVSGNDVSVSAVVWGCIKENNDKQ